MRAPLNSMIRSTPLRCLVFAMMTGLLVGCRVNALQMTIPPDFYWVTDKSNPTSTRQSVYVVDSGDSIRVINPVKDQRQTLSGSSYQTWWFRNTKLDVDAFAIPFKVRRNQGAVPSQYDTDFNAAFYVGHRINSYTYQLKRITPTYAIRQLSSHGFSYGLFVGAGSTDISNDVMRTPINIHYEGVIFDAGIALIYDARFFNYGLAMGFDHLVDLNRPNWIYQHKPWFGVLFGLHLN